MNGIEKIIQQIQTDAQTQIDQILGDAKAQAEKISAAAKAQADAEAADLRAKNEKTAREREARLISAAQMEAHKTALAAKQEMLEQAYQRALEKLCAMPQEQYVAVLADLLAEASTGGKEEAIFSPEDRERVGKAAVEAANQRSGKQMVLSAQTRPIRGGFILRDHNIEVNCTFDTLVRLQKAQTAGAVARMLFPEA